MRLSNIFLVICTLLLCITLWGCSSNQQLVDSEPEQQLAQQSTLEIMFDTSEVFSRNFTGFALYDPEADSMLYAQNADKYFTPASNTKLFTFYAGLKMLPDSIPALQYAVQGDSLIFRGTGAPSFLHPDFGNLEIFNFLKSSDQTLFYTDTHFEDELLGPGWSWSDFNYYYSAQKSPFPMYGNVMRVTVNEIEQTQIASDEDGLKISPVYFRKKISNALSAEEEPLIARSFSENNFVYVPKADTVSYTIDKPYYYSPELLTEMLGDTLGKPITYFDKPFPEEFETLHGVAADTVYKRMLQPSDNFIAEQLLLVAASAMGKPLNARTVIEHMKETYLNGIPDEPQWVDGSGLSRYNMFTPRSIIWLLQQIDDEFTEDRELFALLPAGGKSGTIRNWYAAPDEGAPYVFAKTGTLSNNHCLSGFVITDSGRKLMFSFMNNHYVSSSSVVKREMNTVLQHIYMTY